jgi:hypothetical protein
LHHHFYPVFLKQILREKMASIQKTDQREKDRPKSSDQTDASICACLVKRVIELSTGKMLPLNKMFFIYLSIKIIQK